ncbi:MAG TPA: extracellular solute-binding protein, partial [Longimicrobium sp.]|nr:extracellular solute-binding protein [Longimicrobium sp.]
MMLLAACGTGGGDAGVVTVRFWGMGREGEVVGELVPEFERLNPGIRVDVQQIPWSAAHEKLLTAVVGDATPDVAQLGNTWVPELQALGALEDLTARAAASSSVPQPDFFEGIWDTNVVGGRLYGVPWYVDTRVLFYRPDLLAAAGYPRPPRTW